MNEKLAIVQDLEIGIRSFKRDMMQLTATLNQFNNTLQILMNKCVNEADDRKFKSEEFSVLLKAVQETKGKMDIVKTLGKF